MAILRKIFHWQPKLGVYVKLYREAKPGKEWTEEEIANVKSFSDYFNGIGVPDGAIRLWMLNEENKYSMIRFSDEVLDELIVALQTEVTKRDKNNAKT